MGKQATKNDSFSIFTHTLLKTVLDGKYKGTKTNHSFQIFPTLTASQNHCLKGNSHLFLCSLIRKDVRLTLRASQRSQCSPIARVQFATVMGSPKVKIISPFWIHTVPDTTGADQWLKTPAYFKHATADPARHQGLGQCVTPGCTQATHPQVPTVELWLLTFLTCCFFWMNEWKLK